MAKPVDFRHPASINNRLTDDSRYIYQWEDLQLNVSGTESEGKSLSDIFQK
jgi:hypothetical protein